MNIIYRLTNLSKLEGKRFYVGSKQECSIIEVDGLKTMITKQTGKPYYSSSASLEFKQDVLRGDKFEVEVLEEGLNRSTIYIAEQRWLELLDAEADEAYYNMTTNVFRGSCPKGQIKNTFGETVAEYAAAESSFSKRESTAKSLGFKTFGELYFFIVEQAKTSSLAQISKTLGKNRHFARTVLSGIDTEKALEGQKREKLSEELRDLVFRGASRKKACELLGIEWPVGSLILADFNKPGERAFSVARLNGKSQEEMERFITKEILDGKGFRQVSDETGICYESVKRYFLSCVRKRLKSSDLQ